MARGSWFLGALLGASFAVGCAGGGSDGRPDVVVVVLDTLRADRLGFLGAEREPAPFLARLAGESVVCAGALSTSSWTAPATASLFTGVYPDRHGLTRGLFAQKIGSGEEDEPATLRLRGMRPSLETLPARMRAAGYATFGVSSNPNVARPLGFAEGFDRFACKPRVGAQELFDQLGKWEDEIRGGDPSFVYLHLNDVHSPYEPRAPWYEPQGEEVDPERAYLSEVSWLDQRLEQIFSQYGWDEDAVVMVVSDHGEEFGDHGAVGHGYSLHAELNRVLFLFRSPGSGFSPARVQAPASLIDALPTLLELSGLPVPRGFDGRSLAGLGDAQARSEVEAALERRVVFAHRSNYAGDQALWSASDGDWRLIAEDDDAGELYDLRADPGEQRALAADADPSGERLQRALGELRLRAAGQEDFEATEIEVDGGLSEDLRSLGYVEGR